MTAQHLDVVVVEPHHRGLIDIWHIVLRRTPGPHRGIDLYLTSDECRERGIDLPKGSRQ